MSGLPPEPPSSNPSSQPPSHLPPDPPSTSQQPVQPSSLPPPPLLPLPPGWSEHKAPQGQTYYFNPSTNQSTYIRPTATTTTTTSFLQPPPPPPPPSMPISMRLPNFQQHPPPYLSNPPYLLSGPPPPFPPPVGFSPLQQPGIEQQQKKKKKKEKPKSKVAVPGAPGWFKVTTNHDNVFYTHVETKRSEWTVPEEIREQVRLMEVEERRKKQEEEEEESRVKRLKEEEERKREAIEALNRAKREEEMENKRKRETAAAEEGVAIDSFESLPPDSKRLKVEGPDHDEEEGGSEEERKRSPAEGENGNGGDDDEDEEEDEDDDDDEAWQREMAEEMAAQAAAEERKENGQGGRTAPLSAVEDAKPDYSQPPPGFPTKSQPYLPPPPNVELSLEEAKALFLHMLTSLNGTPAEINPMAPWDKELPKFVHQPAYSVLKQLRERQDAFNEWCKLRLRQKRKSNSNVGSSDTKPRTSTPSHIDEREEKEEGKKRSTDGSTEQHSYRQLLESQVKSTRTRFEDFRKEWKKDRRFFGFGRDDRERERVFKEWLRELGERKRVQALKAESEFLDLLAEKMAGSRRNEARRLEREEGKSSKEAAGMVWREAKKTPGLDSDPRYEAVGSSTRRSELFEEWLKGEKVRKVVVEVESRVEAEEDEQARKKEERARERERAMKEREEKVRKEKARIEAKNRAALGEANREESMIQFNQLLIDAVKDPKMRWESFQSAVGEDDRFSARGLSWREKEDQFRKHVVKLEERRRRALHEVFERCAPGLDVEEGEALAKVREDAGMERAMLKGYLEEEEDLEVEEGERKEEDRKGRLRREYRDWVRLRYERAKKEFHEMLKENSFIDFWGRMKKEKSKAEDADKEEEEEDEDEEEEVDLIEMARKVDLEDITSILRNDARYRTFKHEPELREEWIRDYLAKLPPPKKTVYQKDR
ncbi:hypothetical protein IE53DRAFT_368777 [Violaceomyces palustris]|uniref:Uncharacterized protein n=1 Tax=Violaceomyces palustris TaxID=1673888 RepID=A0ACD0NXN9_9BASI|nr:hypothetical protein IE53DRAFT_368777 [Violaceomyces palustris]